VSLTLAAIIGVSNSLGYLLPAIIGLESMGIPSPGETALVAAAVLASQGKLHIWLVLVIGISSAIVGDNIGYLLGRRFGRELLEARGPLRKHRVRALEIGDGFFKRHGPKTVFFGRWIVAIRVATAWLAGINEMNFRLFFLWNAFGGITWGMTYGLAAYFAGKAAQGVLTIVGAVVGGVVVLVFVARYFWERRRERGSGATSAGPEPRRGRARRS
jgi:membrane protein DedA with SNARE-associated domain